MQSEPVSRKMETTGEESLPRALGPRTLLVAAVAITAFIGSAGAAFSGGPGPGPGDTGLDEIGLGDIGKMGGPDGFGGLGGPGMGFPGGPGMDLPEGPGMDCPAGAPGGSPGKPETPNCDEKKDAQGNKP